MDHPRSRGEYFTNCLHLCHNVGSPPLARGIQPFDGFTMQQVGITPARAGNTGLRCISRVRGEDHPRSRGEYNPVQMIQQFNQGSPPLARGIPDGTPITVNAVRITPARAGNTGRE